MNDMTEISREGVREPQSQLRTSPTIGALAAAIAAAQGEFDAPQKDREVSVNSQRGSYKFKYATMDSVVTATRAALARHKLAVLQPIVHAGGRTVLITRLLHESGEWLESVMGINSQEDAQKFGSALSYARRYAYSSLLGVTPDEDDDGNHASGNTITDSRDLPSRRPAPPQPDRVPQRPPSSADDLLPLLADDLSDVRRLSPDEWVGEAVKVIHSVADLKLERWVEEMKSDLASIDKRYPQYGDRIVEALNARRSRGGPSTKPARGNFQREDARAP